MDNMRYWNDLRTPPPEMLKRITGGRLNGMTDIKPQWRYQAMTEKFGPCGVGWKFVVTKVITVEGSEGVMVAIANIDLYYKDKGEWSDPIPGTGGAMFVAKEKSGPYTSDEAFKMATTDALSTAMKMLGVGSDVYMGQASTSKYAPPKKSIPKPKAKPKVQGWTKAQTEKLVEMSQSIGIPKQNKAMFTGWLAKRFGAETFQDIPATGKAGLMIEKFDELYDEFITT